MGIGWKLEYIKPALRTYGEFPVNEAQPPQECSELVRRLSTPTQAHVYT